MNPDEPQDDELFELFRGLRERVFEGSAAFLGKVMLGVEFHMTARPEAPLAVTMAVHLTNFLSSLVAPRDGDGEGEGAAADGNEGDGGRAPKAPEPPKDPERP